jgi:hypothetical protein
LETSNDVPLDVLEIWLDARLHHVQHVPRNIV